MPTDNERTETCEKISNIISDDQYSPELMKLILQMKQDFFENPCLEKHV